MIEPLPFGRPTDAADATPPEGTVSQEVLVSGMTCGHCVSSVVEEISEIDGVAKVAVDLNKGGLSRVTIHSTTPLESAAVDAAVTEAGYEVAHA